MNLQEAVEILDEANAAKASFIADVLVDLGKLAKGRGRSAFLGDTQSALSFLQLDGKEVAAVSDFLEKILSRIRNKE
jgi:hypothetical protein